MATLGSTALRDFLVQFTNGFTPELAEHFVTTQAQAELQERIQELAKKANEGDLSGKEQSENETYVEAMDVIALMRIKSMQKASGTHPC